MSFKKIALFAIVSAAFSSPVFAQNTITFTGKIYDQACSVQVNGDTDASVALGNYSKDRIANAGDTTDYVPFTLSLVDCPAAGTGVPTQAMFRFNGQTNDSNSNYFKNTSEGGETAAAGVSVELQDASRATVTNNTDTTPVDLPTDGSQADYTFYAAMVNNGETAVVGGDVDSQVTYTVSYK